MCASMCVLLIANSAAVSAILHSEWLTRSAPAWFLRPQVRQALIFVGPVVLILVEWWVYDLIADNWRREREPEEEPPDAHTSRSDA